jgi:hypothetical protein
VLPLQLDSLDILSGGTALGSTGSIARQAWSPAQLKKKIVPGWQNGAKTVTALSAGALRREPEHQLAHSLERQGSALRKLLFSFWT